MICKNCGARIADNAGFCGKCGAKTASGQPSREEIRARVQGGGRQAAPARTAAPARRAAPARTAAPRGAAPTFRLGEQTITLDLPMILALAAGALCLLQLLYLFVPSLSARLVVLATEPQNYSLFSAFKLGGGSVMTVLLVLTWLGAAVSVFLPLLLRGKAMPILTAALAALGLVLLLSSFGLISKASYKSMKLLFVGVLLLLNCLVIQGLIIWSAVARKRGGDAPARAAAARQSAARQPAARRPAPAARPAARRQAPPRRGVNGFSRPSAPAQHVTPPDAETIAALRRMAEMHRQGLVSDEEFARIKAECVARGWIRE